MQLGTPRKRERSPNCHANKKKSTADKSGSSKVNKSTKDAKTQCDIATLPPTPIEARSVDFWVIMWHFSASPRTHRGEVLMPRAGSYRPRSAEASCGKTSPDQSISPAGARDEAVATSESGTRCTSDAADTRVRAPGPTQTLKPRQTNSDIAPTNGRRSHKQKVGASTPSTGLSVNRLAAVVSLNVPSPERWPALGKGTYDRDTPIATRHLIHTAWR